jgi:hypothetical protein
MLKLMNLREAYRHDFKGAFISVEPPPFLQSEFKVLSKAQSFFAVRIHVTPINGIKA